MINPIEHIKQVFQRRRATDAMVEVLESLHRYDADLPRDADNKRIYAYTDLTQALDRGANLDATGVHWGIPARVSALSLTVGHPDAARFLVERGAQFDHTIAASLKALVVKGPRDIPMFSQTTRSINEKTIESVKIILEAGKHPKFDNVAFAREMSEVCNDKTTMRHPARKLVDILDRHFPGIYALCQQSTLQDQTPKPTATTAARPRL